MKTDTNDQAEYTRSLEKLAARFAQYMPSMSYNDSYFGEPAGELKRIAAELNRILPASAFAVAAQQHKAACALTGDAETCPCQSTPRAAPSTSSSVFDAAYVAEKQIERNAGREHRTMQHIQKILDRRSDLGTGPAESAD